MLANRDGGSGGKFIGSGRDAFLFGFLDFSEKFFKIFAAEIKKRHL